MTNYKASSDKIKNTLTKYPEGSNIRKGVISQVLWIVANEHGPTVANALIWKFDLFLHCNGGLNWFDDGTECSAHYEPIGPHRLYMEENIDYRKMTTKEYDTWARSVLKKKMK